jgi:FkbM family methyltransferase
MSLLSRLAGAIPTTRTIATGRAAGLKLAGCVAADPDFARGTYELPVQDAIATALADDDVFYDIGANIGFVSLVAARAVGPRGRVYAFEPVPRNSAAIERSAALNGFAWIDVYSVAAGARSGRDALRLARHIGGAALACAEPPPDCRGELAVDVVAIDDAIGGWGLRPPSLVKIDVEGAELDVLQGMTRTLRTARPMVIYEIDAATATSLERKAEAIAGFMQGLNYDLEALPAAYSEATWQVRHVWARPAEPM